MPQHSQQHTGSRRLQLSQHVIVDQIERAEGALVARASEYPDGHVVTPHRHSRAQLIYAQSGIVTVSTKHGHWMVPPGHGLWVPALQEHAVRCDGFVRMCSLYVTSDAVAALPATPRVVGLTDLMRGLILSVVDLEPDPLPGSRTDLMKSLILMEIPNLPESPLALPLPTEPRLAALCRSFIAEPGQGASIDEWAEKLGMSRRSFTRAFRQETGLSLSSWRQQACIFAAMPRLANGDPVTGVALDLGYESAAAFTTMFKRMTGQVPSRYMLRGDDSGHRDASEFKFVGQKAK